MIARFPARDQRDAALRSLRDCGVIRVRVPHVPRGYQLLQREGVITARSAGGGMADLRLNDRGKWIVGALCATPGGAGSGR